MNTDATAQPDSQKRPWRRFAQDLSGAMKRHNVTNGAAALAYYFFLAIFPALIFLLSLLPYLPIPNLEASTLDLLKQALPGETAQLFTGTVQGIVAQRQGGLLSIGLLLTLWSASAGVVGAMQQLNQTHEVVESRSFFRMRGTALLLTLLFGGLLIAALSLVVFGGMLQGLLIRAIGAGDLVALAFSTVRWGIITLAVLFAFAVIGTFGPDVKRKFRIFTPGGIVGALVLLGASLGFKIYVENFGNYNAMYGSLGAVIALMLWLNIAGLAILLASEINVISERSRATDQESSGEEPKRDRDRAA